MMSLLQAKTKIYTSYTYEQFVFEFKTMLLVYTCYTVAMAGPLYQAALQNQQLILEFYEALSFQIERVWVVQAAVLFNRAAV